jgi:predicted nucleic acid-binding protein
VRNSWIVNASPIICLAKIGRLDLLVAFSDEVVIPLPVVREVQAGMPQDPARLAVESGWGLRREPKTTPGRVIEWGLGEGETSVIALALEEDARAVLDDAAARACARACGVSVIGTLGLILRAARAGLVPSAEEVLDELRRAGLRLAESTVQAALRNLEP